MDVEPSFAALGAIIGAPARANMLSALFDGRALTATELARVAGITSQTASSHLYKLLDAKLLIVEKHGRFRYYKLANPQVAEALEPLTLLTPHKPTPARTTNKEIAGIRNARFCYDHVAGTLGVALTSAMLKHGYLAENERDYRVTTRGEAFLERLGIDLPEIKDQRRVFARKCLDWSERKPHVSGALGAAIASALIAKGWLKRAKTGREVKVTDTGHKAISRYFGVSV
jgi:DNA-binding transcriptional ArsR family regulator